MKAGIYARVSTTEQEPENQLIELRAFAKVRGYEAIEFVDKGFSGSLEADKRPAMANLMKAAQRHQIKAVIVWDFSRFARSMKQLVLGLDQFRGWGVDFISYREGIDTSTSTGRMIFGMIASLAEFEREVIRERVIAGVKRAKSQGVVLGRPKVAVSIEEAVQQRAAAADKPSLRKLAGIFGVSKSWIANTLSKKPHQKRVPIIIGAGR
jgi:DNA invertase Pin-like site-specific DNA recombinase